MLSNIRGTEDSIPFNARITLPAGQYANLNLRTYILGTTRWNGIKRLNCVFTIAPGAAIGSYEPTTPAMTVGGFTDRDLITIINNGSILGAGGYGNAGGASGNAGSGGDGGTALYVRNNITLTNNGSIWGGGGGGGGGAGYYWNEGYSNPYTTRECSPYFSGRCVDWKNPGDACQCCCNSWCGTKNASCYACKQAVCRYYYSVSHARTSYRKHYGTGGAGGRGQGFQGGPGSGIAGAGGGGTGGSGGGYGASGNTGGNTAASGNYKGGGGGSSGRGIDGSGYISYITAGSIRGPLT